MDKKFIWQSGLHSLAVMAYILMVAVFMRNAEKILGKEDNYLSPVLFLMLFVLSAALTGSLVLGRPVIMYLDGQKKDAVKFFTATLGWLFVLTGLLLILDIIIK